MKKTIVTTLAFLVMGISAHASEKICKGFADSPDSAGVVLTLKLQAHSVTVKSAKGDSFDGVYKSNGGKGLSEDGKLFVEIEGQDGDYFNTLSIDRELLKNNTKGILKIHSLSEGWLEAFFNCADIN